MSMSIRVSEGGQGCHSFGTRSGGGGRPNTFGEADRSSDEPGGGRVVY